MNRNKYIIFEYFSLRSFSIFFLTQIKSIPEFTNYSFIYIDSSPFFKYLAKSKLISLLPINLSRLNFRLIDLKDENRELIRLRIFRKDLYQLKSNILSNKDYKKILSNNDQTLYDFQLKGILGGHIMAPDSMARTIFLINLVKYRFSQHLKDTKLILNYRPWINSITKYSEDQKVNTTTITSFFEIKKKLKKYIHSIKYYNSSLYLLLRSFKYATFNPFRESRRYYKNQLLFEGRGDVRFINDGYHSDFFWLMNSEFKDEGLTYISTNNEEIEKLDKNSVNLARFSLNLNPLEYLKKTYKLKYIKQYSNESRSINNFTREYCSNYKYWKQLLKTNNIKILMNWHLFDRFNYPQNH